MPEQLNLFGWYSHVLEQLKPVQKKIADARFVPDTARPLNDCRQAIRGKAPIGYTLTRSKRRTISIIIKDGENAVDVRAPYSVSVTAIEKFLESKRSWIESHLAERQQWKIDHGLAALKFLDGDELLFRGVMVRLCLMGESGPTMLTMRNGVYCLEIGLPPNSAPSTVRAQVETWVREEARRVITERVAAVLPKAKVPFKQWKLSEAKTQWGSCSSNGRMRLNWRLIFFEDSVIDYVIAHELAHLVEMNHSSRFWEEVALMIPDYKDRRAKLKCVSISELPL